jgi:hypothetical protein
MRAFDSSHVEIEYGDLISPSMVENLSRSRTPVDAKSVKLCARALEIEKEKPGIQFGEALREARRETGS